MPTGQNWINFIYVNLGFIAQILIMYYFTAIIEIKKNWPDYRCNPIYMPLSDDISSDFTYCVQSTQINLMGYILQPITYLISSLSSSGSQFTENINGIRDMLSGIRTFISSIVEKIFGVFSNIVIEFQVITIGIKDIIGKVIAVMVTLMYVLDGSNKTMQSAWNGPPGQMVQALCFLPETKIKLKNGNIVLLKDIEIGSILENGDKVKIILKIDNFDLNEKLYKIKGGVNNEYIFVTGDHYIFDNINKLFIKVKNHKDSILQDQIKSTWLSSLVTTNHTIPIGNQLFWDWEDDCLK